MITFAVAPSSTGASTVSCAVRGVVVVVRIDTSRSRSSPI